MERRTITTIVVLALAGLVFLVVRNLNDGEESAEKDGTEASAAAETETAVASAGVGAPLATFDVTAETEYAGMFTAQVSTAGGTLSSVVLHKEQYKRPDKTEGAPDYVPEERLVEGPYEVVGPWDAIVDGQVNLPFHLELKRLEWGDDKDATIDRLVRAATAITFDETRIIGSLPPAGDGDLGVRSGDTLHGADGAVIGTVDAVESLETTVTFTLKEKAGPDFPETVTVRRVGKPRIQYETDPRFVRVASPDTGTVIMVWPNPERDNSDVWIERTWTATGDYQLAHSTRFVNMSKYALAVQTRLQVVGWVDPWLEPPGMFSTPMQNWAPACHVGGSFEQETLEDLLDEDNNTVGYDEGAVRWLGINSQYFLLAAVFKEGGVNGICTVTGNGQGIIASSLDRREDYVGGRKIACLPDWFPKGKRSPDVRCSEAMTALGVSAKNLDETTLSNALDLYKGPRAQAIEYKHMLAALGESTRDDGATINFTVFAGPKDLDLLEPISPALEDALDFWWFGFLAKPMLWTMKWLNAQFSSWLLAILILTILIKGLMLPLTQKSYVQMQRMQTLKPEMEELQKKHANDKQKLQTEMMNMYKRHNVNPLGGCLPMVFQMPVYIALYRCIYSAVDLYQAPLFGWITDMTQPDPYYILPILLGLFMLVQQMFMPTSPGADPTQQKIIKYMMPAMFALFMLMLPSGLVFYIAVSTVISIGQQWLIKRKFANVAPATRRARSKAS